MIDIRQAVFEKFMDDVPLDRNYKRVMLKPDSGSLVNINLKSERFYPLHELPDIRYLNGITAFNAYQELLIYKGGVPKVLTPRHPNYVGMNWSLKWEEKDKVIKYHYQNPDHKSSNQIVDRGVFRDVGSLRKWVYVLDDNFLLEASILWDVWDFGNFDEDRKGGK